MGIPYYFSWIIKNHKDIIFEFNNDCLNIENLYLDCNSIIYDSLDISKYINIEQFENYIITCVIEKINLIISIIKPTKNIMITFDGVPPIAKLCQQKNRRYKSWYQSNILDKSMIWDTCSITPGTKFMDKLNIGIYEYYRDNRFKNNNIILDLSDSPGEGEHKIFQYIRKYPHINDNTVIYGMDADLIMLSLNHLKLCKNIFLYRETPHFIQSLLSHLNPENKYLIDIFKLANYIYTELTGLSYDNINNELFYSKINDYILICFLLGNDFLPHFPAINIRINGFNILFDLYKSLFGKSKHLSKSGNIIWPNFKLYIQTIANNEHNFIKSIYNIREKYSKKYYPSSTNEEIERKFIEMPKRERNIEVFINPYETAWEFRYYYSLFDINIDIDTNAVINICKNYLESFQWTFNYYSNECLDWKQCYKYHYPPLFMDLCKNIPYFNSEIPLNVNKTILHPFTLLAYVLPKKSLNLLPNNIHNYLLTNYENYYKENYKFIYAFCNYFWEGHVQFPQLNIDNFIENINSII